MVGRLLCFLLTVAAMLPGCDLAPDGGRVIFEGKVISSANGEPVPGIPVELYGISGIVSDDYTKEGATRTGADGTFSVSANIGPYFYFQLRFNGSPPERTQPLNSSYFTKEIEVDDREAGGGWSGRVELRPAGVLLIDYTPIAPQDTIFFSTPPQTDTLTANDAPPSAYHLFPDRGTPLGGS